SIIRLVLVLVLTILSSCQNSDVDTDPELEVITFGGDEFDSGKDIATDALGNVYVFGDFDGSAAIGSNVLTAETRDVFIAKFNSKLELQWVKNFGGPGFEEASSITVDDHGNAYLAGACLFSPDT